MHAVWKSGFALCLALLGSKRCLAQGAVSVTAPKEGAAATLRNTAALDSLLAAREVAKKEQRVFKLGFSVGWRQLVSTDSTLRRDVAIDPATNRVVADPIDHGDVMASGVLAVFPRKRDPAKTGTRNPGNAWRFGLLANVKLAVFGAEEISTFNQSLEGGIGPIVRLSDDFGLALTLERVFSRRPRSFVVPGAPLYDSDDLATRKPLKSVSREDDRFFYRDNLTAVSFKFVYFLR